MLKYLFCLFISLWATRALGKLKLPAIIDDNMVLQRESNVPLWGESDPNTTVRIVTSWNNKSYSVQSDVEGHWKVMVNTTSAGGPYTITFNDGDPLTLKNILIGEVWLCSGQSNMEISMKGYQNQPVLNANELLTQADNSKLRLFHVKRAVSNVPLSDCSGSWKRSTPENASSFSAVGFQFAQRLQKILKVPVGIIEAAWGGTPIEAWMNSKSLQYFTKTQVPVAGDGIPADRMRSTCLFNGMLAPITGFGIKGILWYQGAANVSHKGSHPYNYDEMMAAMVKEWRRLWQRDTLPFYYVQIAPWEYSSNPDSAAYLRAAQARAQREIPNSGMVVSIDVGSPTTVHPPDKTTISNRLLYWALGDAYHKKGIAYKSPTYKGMEKKDNGIVITFSNTPHGFTSFGEDINGFEIAGADHQFYPAEVKIYRKTIVVKSGQVPNPVAVRYAFKDWVAGNLYNTAGLPVAPFRTDNW